MADGVDLSAFDKPAPQAISLDQFDKPAAVDISHFDGAPVDQSQPNLPIEQQVVESVKNAIPDSVKEAGSYLLSKVEKSPVGTALKYLAKPGEFVAGRAIYALDKTVSPGIEQALNPNKDWVPDVAFHDVANYELPTNDKAQALLEKYGIQGAYSQAGRLLYAGAKTTLGLAADLATDPLMYVGAGELTKAAKAAKGIEDLDQSFQAMKDLGEAGKARYALSFGVGDAKVGITTGQAASAIRTIPGGGKALDLANSAAFKLADATRYFDYHTGNPEVDGAASVHAALKRGDQQMINENFVKPLFGYKFTPAENGLLAHAVESTSNAAAKEELLSAVEAKAKSAGIDLPETRLHDIAEAGLKIKSENARDLMEREAAKLYNPQIDGVLENYLVHKSTPEARAFSRKNPELAAAALEASLEKGANNAVRDSVLSTYDSGKYERRIKGTLERANAIMKEKTGVAAWFEPDPIKATAMKRMETRRLVRDKELIDKISKFGVEERTARELGIAGEMKRIQIPEYRGSLPSQDLVFPKNIADRIGYYITPRETGPFLSFVDGYNRIFRNVALATPDYYIRNWGENLFKNWVQGVKLEDYLDTTRVSRGTGKILIKGKEVPVSDIRALIQKWGIDSGGQYREGIESMMHTGKRLEAERKLVNAAGGVKSALKKTVNILHQGGESGENFTRRSLFINRLKQGYSPANAALDVEKYLFDYGRTSKTMDNLRRFWNPFFQHAYKTLLITPEMVLRSPGKYNFIHNQLMSAIEAGIHDPVTSAEVKTIIPPYRKIQDPVVGPILSGNSWLRRIFENKTAIDNPGKLGGMTAMLFKMPIGLSILNEFALWNDELGRQGGVASPMLRSFLVMATGKDPYTNKNIDPTTQSADMARRFNYAMNTAIEGMVPVPQTYKFVKQQLGIGDPKYFTPTGVLMLHGSLGKFVNVTNLDRDYFFRMYSLNKAKTELQKNLLSTTAAERSGRTAALALSDKGYLRSIYEAANSTESSAYLYNKWLKAGAEEKLVKSSAAGLTGQMTAVDIVKHLKDVDQRIEELGKQYEVSSHYRLEQLKNASKEQIKAIVPEANIRDFDRAPQSVNRSPQSVGGQYFTDKDIKDVIEDPEYSPAEKSETLDNMLKELDGEIEDVSKSGDKRRVDELAKNFRDLQGAYYAMEEQYPGGEKESPKMMQNNRWRDVVARAVQKQSEESSGGDEDSLIRAPRGSDEEEAALRDQLTRVQRGNRNPNKPKE